MSPEVLAWYTQNKIKTFGIGENGEKKKKKQVGNVTKSTVTIIHSLYHTKCVSVVGTMVTDPRLISS